MKSKFFTLTAAVLTLALLSTVAVAMRSNEVEYTYFNAKGKVVGGKTYHCAGGTSAWGSMTPNFDKSSYPCD